MKAVAVVICLLLVGVPAYLFLGGGGFAVGPDYPLGRAAELGAELVGDGLHEDLLTLDPESGKPTWSRKSTQSYYRRTFLREWLEAGETCVQYGDERTWVVLSVDGETVRKVKVYFPSKTPGYAWVPACDFARKMWRTVAGGKPDFGLIDSTKNVANGAFRVRSRYLNARSENDFVKARWNVTRVGKGPLLNFVEFLSK